MSDPLYLLSVEDGVALVTLNRPQAMNSINRDLRLQLLELFPALDLRDDVNVIVLTGAGDKAFCTGADLKERAGRTTAQRLCARAPYPVRSSSDGSQRLVHQPLLYLGEEDGLGRVVQHAAPVDGLGRQAVLQGADGLLRQLVAVEPERVHGGGGGPETPRARLIGPSRHSAMIGAVEKNRTSTVFPPQRPQRCASTSSATTACPGSIRAPKAVCPGAPGA